MTSPLMSKGWACPYCSWTYTSPIMVGSVWHRCPARDWGQAVSQAGDLMTRGCSQ